MKKIVSIILSATILMLIAISPVSANNDYEDNGDFRYIYQLNGSILNALYKKSSSKQEIKRIEFPVEYKGKK